MKKYFNEIPERCPGIFLMDRSKPAELITLGTSCK